MIHPDPKSIPVLSERQKTPVETWGPWIFTVFSFALLWIVFTTWSTISTTWNDSDTFWHIKVGQSMLEQGRVITEAINTFNFRPFVPHEAGFQIVVAWLYNHWGWHGFSILVYSSLFFLIIGFYELILISRKEEGVEGLHPLFHVIIPLLAFIIFLEYFRIRPQILSVVATLWFFIYLRKFQMIQTFPKYATIFAISVFIANVHAGTFPLMIVLTGLNLLESLVHKRWIGKNLILLFLVLAGGVLNPNGISSLAYILQATKGNLHLYILEWKPIDYRSYLAGTFGVVALIFSYAWGPKKGLYRTLFFISILLFGMTSYKTALYIFLFLPYVASLTPDKYPMPQSLGYLYQDKIRVSPKGFYGLLMTSLFVWSYFVPYEQPITSYPVKETDYILSQWRGKSPPKVLGDYNSSGYLMFRGVRVLADGRFDPFVQKNDGPYGYNDFLRSIAAFNSTNGLWLELQYDNPDYLILPHSDKPIPFLDHVKEVLGTPDYMSSYGMVWKRRGGGWAYPQF